MEDILKSIYDLLGQEHPIAKVIGVTLTIVTAIEVGRRIYPSTRRLISFWLRNWKVRRLDEVAKRLIEGEQRYIGAILQFIESKNWDPKYYVQPKLDLSKKVFEPVDPILVLLDSVAARRDSLELNPYERKEKYATERVRNLLGVIRELGSIVILGDPGAGKTTCLLQLGIEVANRAVLSSRLYPFLPVLLPLNEFTDPIDKTGSVEPIINFIKAQIRQQSEAIDGADISGRLDTLIRDGRLLFLFDALDEMPRDGYYDRFRLLSRFMKSCQTRNINNLFLFTCRRLDFVDDPTFPVQQLMLSPFSDRQIKAYFKRYLPSDYNSAYSSFLSAGSDLATQARSPFFLSLIAACVKSGAKPGKTWDVLIQTFVQVAFEKERSERGYQFSEWQSLYDLTIQWLSDLAFKLVDSRATGTKGDAALVEETLKEAGASTDSLDIACECGILRRIGNTGAIRFEHHRLQEYFAALVLAQLIDDDQVDVYEYLDDIWWREVVLMAAGLMKHPDILINQILDAAEEVNSHSYYRFSEVYEDFARVMVAMNCFRPASHALSFNTKQRLIHYLCQFLRYGNILQKVRALRVVPQFQDDKVFHEAKRLLKDSSKWVRETALLVLAEGAVFSPKLTSSIHEKMLAMLKSEHDLIQGIQDFPVLLRHKKTRTIIPLYIIITIIGFARTCAIWLLLAAAVVTYWSINKESTYVTLYFGPILTSPLFYLLAKKLMKRRYISNLRWNIAASFNRFTLFLFGWVLILGNIMAALSNLGSSTGSIGNIGAGLINALLIWLILVLTVRSYIPLYLKWRERRAQRWFNLAKLNPEDSELGRQRQALRLINAAREEADIIVRQNLINAIRSLLPLNKPVLTALEEFCESELDVDVRTKAYIVYEQIELSIEREGRSKERLQ